MRKELLMNKGKKALKAVIVLFIVSLINLNCTVTTKSSVLTNKNLNLQDTILSSDSIYLVYEFVDNSNYIIKWGITGKFENLSIDTFKTLGSEPFRLKDYNKEAIYLTQSCGTSCAYAFILPLSKGSKPKEYYQAPIIYDLDKKLVVYETNVKDRNYWFVVENYITGRQMTVIKDVICHGPTAEYCVQEIIFQNDKLEISYIAGSNPTIVTSQFDISKLKESGVPPQE